MVKSESTMQELYNDVLYTTEDWRFSLLHPFKIRYSKKNLIFSNRIVQSYKVHKNLSVIHLSYILKIIENCIVL